MPAAVLRPCAVRARLGHGCRSLSSNGCSNDKGEAADASVVVPNKGSWRLTLLSGHRPRGEGWHGAAAAARDKGANAGAPRGRGCRGSAAWKGICSRRLQNRAVPACAAATVVAKKDDAVPDLNKTSASQQFLSTCISTRCLGAPSIPQSPHHRPRALLPCLSEHHSRVFDKMSSA